MNEPRALKPIDEVRHTLSSNVMKEQIKAALPSHVSVEKFNRVVITALQTSAAAGQDLLQCDRQSLYASCMKAASMGLLPDGREAALVKYGDKVSLLPMIEGLMKLVRNSGEVSNWSIQIVHENDSFEYELGDNERIVHKPAMKNRGEIVGAYSIVTLKNGEKSREWMDRDQIEAIRQRSRGANGGPWKSDYGEMARKTVGRRHIKRLPKSTDVDDYVRQMDDEDPIADAPAPQPTTKPSRPSVLQSVVDSVPETRTVDAEVVKDQPKSDTNGDII